MSNQHFKFEVNLYFCFIQPHKQIQNLIKSFCCGERPQSSGWKVKECQMQPGHIVHNFLREAHLLFMRKAVIQAVFTQRPRSSTLYVYQLSMKLLLFKDVPGSMAAALNYRMIHLLKLEWRKLIYAPKRFPGKDCTSLKAAALYYSSRSWLIFCRKEKVNEGLFI
jgi:hypothetical protein